MTDPAALLALLKEARTDLDMWHKHGWQESNNLLERLGAAIAALEAAPERKCGTCKFWKSDPEQSNAMACVHLDWVMTTKDWFCADWQRKETP